jgi:hypothetical protein
MAANQESMAKNAPTIALIIRIQDGSQKQYFCQRACRDPHGPLPFNNKLTMDSENHW